MSPLAKLLQIKPVPEIQQRQSVLGKVWTKLVAILRSTKIQRRIRRMEVVERVALGNKQSVILMRMDNREFMVGCCGDAVVLLAPPAPPAQTISTEVKKVQAKRRTRSKSAKPRVARPVLATSSAPAIIVEPVVPVPSPMKARAIVGKTKPSAEIALPLKRRTPSKARLVKAFAAGSAR